MRALAQTSSDLVGCVEGAPLPQHVGRQWARLSGDLRVILCSLLANFAGLCVSRPQRWLYSTKSTQGATRWPERVTRLRRRAFAGGSIGQVHCYLARIQLLRVLQQPAVVSSSMDSVFVLFLCVSDIERRRYPQYTTQICGAMILTTES
ncbi:hypothetical protein T440DRAFT_504730 [Plenodomus tracheiphilus IPT5]|uniref:Uncharacterized protein n=1 Tax=Plenodomus tracheiphilus IPT5 TaxID=1408161 RepID=A0A6A7BLE5_9PLEO|nr:hypothetical protein T440DRAFT_504730 [Plenodomus tracheiphilus IPT5]